MWKLHHKLLDLDATIAYDDTEQDDLDIPDPGQQPLQAEDPPPDDQPLDIPLADVPEDEPEESQTSQVDPVQGIPAPDLDATLPFAEGDDQSQDAADSDNFIMNLDDLRLT